MCLVVLRGFVTPHTVCTESVSVACTSSLGMEEEEEYPPRVEHFSLIDTVLPN